MIEIEDMGDREIKALAKRLNFGHLACARENQPYLIPVHFVYYRGKFYIYTTEGKKTDILRENPLVCLQFEDIKDREHWVSVVVNGKAKRVDETVIHDNVIARILKMNPKLTPAISIRWMDNWFRENREVVFAITPVSMSGRQTIDRKISGAFVPSASRRKTL